MRVRLIALTVLFFAIADAAFLVFAFQGGWLGLQDLPPYGVVIFSLAFTLAALAVLGALSVLLTERRWDRATLPYGLACDSCGAEPRADIAFCHHCGDYA